jgi:hypothetical protein
VADACANSVAASARSHRPPSTSTVCRTPAAESSARSIAGVNARRIGSFAGSSSQP